MFNEVLESIKKFKKIFIFRHSWPDGDATGSQVGLKYVITENFPDKQVYLLGDDFGRYSFVNGASVDEVEDSEFAGSLAIILDSAEAKLVSDERYKSCDYRIRMDHHIFCEKFAELEIVDTSYESASSLVADFAIRSGLSISENAASAFYTGIATDSGRFKYDSTSSRTFSIVSELMKSNIDISKIYGNLYRRDFTDILARADFVQRIKFSEKKVAYVYTTLEQYKELAEKYNLSTFGVSRGMVNEMADINGIHIWVNFTETEETVLVELRSDSYNINPIAVKYGGGGHAKASGCDVDNYETAMKLIADCEALMEQENERSNQDNI